MRKTKDGSDFLLVCCNLTPVVRNGYMLGVPQGGTYREIFNSDSTYYGGSNVGNGPAVHAEHVSHHGRSHRLEQNLPPLAIVVLKPEG